MIRKRAAGRARGVTVRLPRAQQIYRHFPPEEGGYNAALAAAGIGDGEIVEAQAHRLGHERAMSMAAEEIAGLDDERLREAGVAEASLTLLREDGAGSLPFCQAAALAWHLGGSLEWLAGQSLHRGESPADLVFDAAAFEESRRALGISEAEVREVLRLDRGAYRRFVNGRFEPTLYEVLQAARSLGDRPLAPCYSGSDDLRGSLALPVEAESSRPKCVQNPIDRVQGRV